MKRARLSQAELHRRSINQTGAGVLNTMSESQFMYIGSSASENVLNATVQGTAADQRVGNQVKEVGLRIKGMIMQTSATPSDVCSCVRVLVFRDRDGVGSTPSIADVLEYNSSPANIGSPVKWSNRKRFAILLDQTIALQAQSSVAAAAVACSPVDIDLRGSDFDNTLTYNASSLDAGSLLSGAVYCVMFYCHMAQDPVSGASPKFVGTSSFFYRDV